MKIRNFLKTRSLTYILFGKWEDYVHSNEGYGKVSSIWHFYRVNGNDWPRCSAVSVFEKATGNGRSTILSCLHILSAELIKEAWNYVNGMGTPSGSYLIANIGVFSQTRARVQEE